MKFVCRQCEQFMFFQDVEPIKENSLGVTFECLQCKTKISMVTNAGETQLVHALGVQLGGRNGPPEPLELTRNTLRSQAPELRISNPPSPFPLPLAGEGVRRTGEGEQASKCPFADVVAQMQDSVSQKEEGIVWTAGAQERLNLIPELVRPFAKMAIERMAKDRGAASVDEALMDQAKELFMQKQRPS